MPGAKTHDMLTVVTGIVGMPVVWALLPDHNLAAVVTLTGAHLISGLAFSPDLDLASEIYRRWGPLGIIWYPYREVVHHRSWISHSLILGPLLRLVYFLVTGGLLMMGVLYLLNLLTPLDVAGLWGSFSLSVRALWDNHFSMIVYFLLGFITGSAVHSIADWIFEGDDPFHISLPGPRWFRRLLGRQVRQVQRHLHITTPPVRTLRRKQRRRRPSDDDWHSFR